MNTISARCGHVKRQLNRGQRLTGKVLEFALSLIEEGAKRDELTGRIHQKLLSGSQLDDYERHIMVDVVLLHTRLGA